MNYAHLIEQLQVLPVDKQAVVLDFVDYLASRFANTPGKSVGDWSTTDFSGFSLTQAMRDMEDEPELYSSADLKESWR